MDADHRHGVACFWRLFYGWDPIVVFVFYIFETVIIGIFNIIKMLSVCLIGDKKVAM